MMFKHKENTIIEALAFELSHSWFKVDGNDITLVEGVSLGMALQIRVFEILYPVSQVNADGNDLRSKLKKLNLEWHARALASRLMSKDVDKSPCDYLFINDVNNRPMLDALNIVADALAKTGQRVSGLTVDNNISSQSSIESKLSWFKVFSAVDYWQAMRISRRVTDTLRAARPAILKSFDKLGAGRFGDQICDYAIQQVPQLVRELLAIRRGMKIKSPRAIVLSSDAHRVCRLVVQEARLQAIPTAVLQHGATIWRYGYVPVVADKMLVWGSDAKEWFTGHGVSEDKLSITGNVRQSQRSPQRLDRKASPSIYIFPNPIDRDVTRQAVAAFIDYMESSTLEGIIKLHPSERNLAFFESLIPQHLEKRVHLSTKGMAEAGVAEGDIAIVINSTAGIDACMLGATVVNIDVPGIPNPIDYEKYAVGVRCSVEGVGDAITRMLAVDKEELEANRQRFIQAQLHHLDGQATVRACEVIQNIATNKNE